MSDGLELKSVNAAEKFIARQNNAGNDVRWDNYDIVFFRPDERGIKQKQGAFRGGKWGFENRSPLLDDGTWKIDWRNVR